MPVIGNTVETDHQKTVVMSQSMNSRVSPPLGDIRARVSSIFALFTHRAVAGVPVPYVRILIAETSLVCT